MFRFKLLICFTSLISSYSINLLYTTRFIFHHHFTFLLIIPFNLFLITDCSIFFILLLSFTLINFSMIIYFTLSNLTAHYLSMNLLTSAIFL